jgi:hypothetical protein
VLHDKDRTLRAIFELRSLAAGQNRSLTADGRQSGRGVSQGMVVSLRLWFSQRSCLAWRELCAEVPQDIW